MSRLHFTAFAGMAACVALLRSGPTLSADEMQLGLRPGLWQVNITYQSINGRQVLDNQYLLARLLKSIDPTDLAIDRANMALSQSGCENGGAAGRLAAGMQQADFNNSQKMPDCDLPDVMRMRADAAANEDGADMGATASFRICITPEIARLDAPVLDEGNRCRPTQLVHSGKRATFQFSCSSNGTAITGHGESHRSIFGHVLTVTDMNAAINQTTRLVVHERMEMTYRNADCGSLTPPAPAPPAPAP